MQKENLNSPQEGWNCFNTHAHFWKVYHKDKKGTKFKSFGFVWEWWWGKVDGSYLDFSLILRLNFFDVDTVESWFSSCITA